MNQPDPSGNAAGPLPVPPALVILLLGLILTLPSFFLRDLWNPDEPRYAEVSREMVVLNDYLVPHLNGEIYAEKPPLFFWLSAFFQALGFGVRAGRIVTAFAVMGTLFLTWALARLWFPPPTPLLSVLILATAFQFLWLGRVGVLDVPLGFFILMAVYGFCRFRRDGGWWAVLFYGGMGLATLTKGPVGILIICLGAISVAMFTEAPRRGRTLHILWGAPLTAAIICAWLIPASIQGGPEYRNIILFQQNIGRMVSSWSHARPWYYYFTTLPVHFFPWCLFVPWALVWLWRKGKTYCGGGGRCMILWFCLGFLAFSIISGKRGRYLIPLLPALAICVAVFLDAVARSAAAGKLRVWGRRLLLFQN
ncbi:MAG: glycosyltransferase family 39 protein, partial [Acidobacteria bacterium]|nr:glycosyltransferase family 39 protein [Acidobacteriota bacterium]